MESRVALHPHHPGTPGHPPPCALGSAPLQGGAHQPTRVEGRPLCLLSSCGRIPGGRRQFPPVSRPPVAHTWESEGAPVVGWHFPPDMLRDRSGEGGRAESSGESFLPESPGRIRVGPEENPDDTLKRNPRPALPAAQPAATPRQPGASTLGALTPRSELHQLPVPLTPLTPHPPAPARLPKSQRLSDAQQETRSLFLWARASTTPAKNTQTRGGASGKVPRIPSCTLVPALGPSFWGQDGAPSYNLLLGTRNRCARAQWREALGGWV